MGLVTAGGHDVIPWIGVLAHKFFVSDLFLLRPKRATYMADVARDAHVAAET